MEPKKIGDSATVMPVRMLPQDANPAGFVHGGVILKQIDLVGGIVAMRHCRAAAVTVSIDRMDFLAPAHVGEVMVFKGSVNYAGSTSMEVGVRVEAEDLMTGEIRHAGSAYLTFVAMSKDRKPTAVPPLFLETPLEHRRHAEALIRRETRLAERRREKAGQDQARSEEGRGGQS
jgi:acyl-CoA hydrolase